MQTSTHRTSRLILSLLLLLACWTTLPGATKYVSNAGNNSNSGNSWAQSWLTLQYASTHIAAGDTVWIQNGTYTGFDCRITGTAANPIVFIAAGTNVVINVHNPITMDGINIEDADYIEINGVRVIDQPRNGIRLALSDHCIVRNTYCDHNFERGIFTGFTDDLLLEYNECLNSIDEHGIYVSNSSDRSIIRYNVCHHNNRGGIQINADASQEGADGISSDPEIYGNMLYENGVAGGAAINLDGVERAFIYNNLLYQNHASGIALFQQDGEQPSFDAVIAFNTIVNASNARWCVLVVNGSTGAQIYNNILYNQHAWRGSIAVDADAMSGFSSDYNMVVNSLSNNGDGVTKTLANWRTDTGNDLHSILAGSLASIFVSPGSDYHLLTNSAAVNAGNAGFAFGVTDDFDGNVRPQGPQPDLGAYELSGPLAIDEHDVIEKTKHEQLKRILISPVSILWPEEIDGTLLIMSIDGKVIAQQELEGAGEYSLTDLVPGYYFAAIRDHHGMQWIRGFMKP